VNKDELLDNISSLFSDFKILKRDIENRKINNNKIKLRIRELTRFWFESISIYLDNTNIPKEFIRSYNESLEKLLDLTYYRTKFTTYINKINEIVISWQANLYTPLLLYATPIHDIKEISFILKNASNEEKEYLQEAIGCTQNGFFRASIILGWSAGISRLHKIIEKKGVNIFNKKSEEMFKLNTGRYKRFKKKFNVVDLNDLRASVFDNDLIWVLEYWGFFDSNQADRLHICFTMRNNAAHPGEAPISPENLASFYSDINSFIFQNPKLSLL
jgi:hypothetical protein